MNRRSFLTTAGTALLIVGSGCASDRMPLPDQSPETTPTDHDSVTVRTPAPDDCTVVSELRPTPDSPRTREYPSLPESASRAESRSFAVAFERAFRINERIPEYRSIQTEITAPDWATTAMKDGHAVGLDARIQFGTPVTETPPAESPATPTTTATPRPSGFFEYTVYYLVTRQFALRGQPLDGDPKKGGSPELTDARPVACNGDDQ